MTVEEIGAELERILRDVDSFHQMREQVRKLVDSMEAKPRDKSILELLQELSRKTPGVPYVPNYPVPDPFVPQYVPGISPWRPDWKPGPWSQSFDGTAPSLWNVEPKVFTGGHANQTGDAQITVTSDASVA